MPPPTPSTPLVQQDPRIQPLPTPGEVDCGSCLPPFDELCHTPTIAV
jgi:hypothetical protein